jgi:lysophospholipase L1-like esterase
LRTACGSGDAFGQFCSANNVYPLKPATMQYCTTRSQLTFVDIVPQMIGADGKPRKELLLEDGLHMTPAGYKIWNDALRPLLQLSQSNQ